MNEALCRTIREAFAEVTLGSGIGLQEAQGIDDYKQPDECARLRATDEKEDWSRLSSEALNRCHSSLNFFDAEGMRFHLPAFLIADLQGRNSQGRAFVLTQLSEYNIRQFSLLTPEQRSAVRAFLIHIVKQENYEFERPVILSALDGFWAEAP